METIGDHIRKRRLDLGLLQKEVAERLGVTKWTIRNWELGWSAPAIRCIPEIVRFLGYSPLPTPELLAERLLCFRRLRGISREKLARSLGIDPATLWRWESGRAVPSPKLEPRLLRIGLGARADVA